MSDQNTLSNSSTIAVTEGYLVSDLDNEKIILDSKSGIYYGLNSVGANIWNLIQQPTKIEKVRDAISAKYSIEPSQCESDILALLDELAAEGLIEVHS